MTARADLIAGVLARPRLRPVLAWELRGPLVQLVGAGSTVPDYQAPRQLLAEAIDQALTDAEEKDTPAPAAAPSGAGAGTADTPRAHALVITADRVDLHGACSCGQALGRSPWGRRTDGLVGLWQQHLRDHVSEVDAAWADALTALHPSTNGAS
ncbi:hypothetical protein ACIPEL_36155 [Streptomyces griseoviridis]